MLRLNIAALFICTTLLTKPPHRAQNFPRTCTTIRRYCYRLFPCLFVVVPGAP
jgi:hypothetical protein